MRNTIVLWSGCGSDQFEEKIPLHFIGQRNAKLGFSNDIDILFLQGYDRLEESYRKDLQSCGFKLYDLKDTYTQLSDKYQSLNRFGDFEKKCFLRWLVLKEFYAGETIVHYDGDVVFNEDPLVLQQKLSGKTFVLQGCPAMVAICNTAWYEEYLKNLDLFVSDIEQYSSDAWKMRDGWQLSVKTKWAGYRDRNVISSDQDLISHLLHTDQLPQDSPAEILSCVPEHIFFENALCIEDANDDFPYRYRRTEGIDYLNDKRVAFWHIQTDFNIYLYDFIIRKQYLLMFAGSTLRYGNKGLEKFIHRFIRRIKGVNRYDVYKYFFQEYDFSEVLTNQVWWQNGIFV
ncbi:MAG: hypothetical protein KAJ19_18710 [Gammaproteobacteria bacterium]|nr:hypothetical protein [Gammaproteobacteria bacterium]